MLMTTVLLFIAMREIWRLEHCCGRRGGGRARGGGRRVRSANMMKIADGGYVPVLLAAAVYGMMVVWHIGARAVGRRVHEHCCRSTSSRTQIKAQGVPRVPGTAVFLTRTQRDAPPVLIWHVRHSRALHERVFILNVDTQMVPLVSPAKRLTSSR